VEADDVERGVAERFLEACGLPADEAAVALGQMRATAASSGGAVVEVTIGDDGRRARVSAAEPLVSLSA
jgi:hypothetical protein